MPGCHWINNGVADVIASYPYLARKSTINWEEGTQVKVLKKNKKRALWEVSFLLPAATTVGIKTLNYLSSNYLPNFVTTDMSIEPMTQNES